MSLAALPSVLLIPPLNLFAAACAGALGHRRRAGRRLLAIGLGGMWLLSMPFVSGTLLSLLERNLPAVPAAGAAPAAIVILSGDETDIVLGGRLAEQVGALTLQRELAGVLLARQTSLPILVTGGEAHPGDPPLAQLMTQSLQTAFGVQPKWIEDKSLDTWQNAVLSARMLKDAGIGSIYLVTSAWHMRRALVAFRAAGLVATAAPTPLDAPPRAALHNFLPHVSSWQESYYALHEWIGYAWYLIRVRLF
jgi:uncharacterized SAM-binding protein YcdF (DUF218 family)